MGGDTESVKNYFILQKQISCELNKLISCDILYSDEAMNIANDILFKLINIHTDCIFSSLEIDSVIVEYITTEGPYYGLDPKYFDLIREKLNNNIGSPLVETNCAYPKDNIESKEREIIWLF